MNWFIGHLVGDYLIQDDWMAQNKKRSTLACSVHVALYTLSVWVFTFWPWWAVAIVFATHFIQDRTNIIVWSMKHKNQSAFASPPMAPWSIIVVDNVWHLVSLFLIELAVLNLGA